MMLNVRITMPPIGELNAQFQLIDVSHGVLIVSDGDQEIWMDILERNLQVKPTSYVRVAGSFKITKHKSQSALVSPADVCAFLKASLPGAPSLPGAKSVGLTE